MEQSINPEEIKEEIHDTSDLKPLDIEISEYYIEDKESELSENETIIDKSEITDNINKNTRSERYKYDKKIIDILSKNKKPIKDREISDILQTKFDITLKPIQVRSIRTRLEKQGKLSTPQKKTPESLTAPFTFDSFENLPIRRKTSGRKNNRDSVKVSLTLDKNLYEIIQKEAERKYWSETTVIEWLLWNFLGKPELSYSPKPEPAPQIEAPQLIRVEPSKPKKKPEGKKGKSPE